MKFLLRALLLVGTFSLRAARASGDDRKKVAHTLEGELKAQTVVLRNYYRGDRLEYDSNGQLKEGGPPGTWTLDGHVRVSKVQMGRDTLEIDGNREFMAFDLKTKAWAALPDQEPLTDAADIQEHLGHGIDLILDGGVTLNEPSTVLDLTGPAPVVLREGKGRLEGVVA